MKAILWEIKDKLTVTPKELFVYIVLYLSFGFCMDAFGRLTQIAWFLHRWQVLTCYGLYLIPASLYVRNKTKFDQILYGLFFLSLLEFAGYALQTSVASPDNILDQWFTQRNFSLCMSLFFAPLLLLGNSAVKKILHSLTHSQPT